MTAASLRSSPPKLAHRRCADSQSHADHRIAYYRATRHLDQLVQQKQ
jgi:hypothetical protein